MVVGLLRGFFMFMVDLVCYFDLFVEVDFLIVFSYGLSIELSCDVKILKDLDSEI